MDEDSNPTPRASVRDSCSIINSRKEHILDKSTKLSTKTPQISIVEISSSKDTESSTTELLRKIDEITQNASKPYFRNILELISLTLMTRYCPRE